MAQQRDQQNFYDQQARARRETVELSAGDILEHPEIADEINRNFEAAEDAFEDQDANTQAPPDGGLAELIGVGEGAAPDFDSTRIPAPVPEYDENFMSERMIATGDLYYLYQHEKIGIFRIIQKL